MIGLRSLFVNHFVVIAARPGRLRQRLPKRNIQTVAASQRHFSLVKALAMDAVFICNKPVSKACNGGGTICSRRIRCASFIKIICVPRKPLS